MRAQFLSILAAASAVSAQSSSAAASAPVATGNPAGAVFVATLPEQQKYTVRGSVQAKSAPDGNGVTFAVSLTGLPSEGGPFLYHIHEKPVPADGNCTGTGAHLDPYKRGEDPPCDASKPETCQTGDLSGKYGKPAEKDYAKEYTDLYTATSSSNPSFFGNLSIVVHLANKTRIACANFSALVPGGGSSSLPVSVGTSSGYALPTGTGSYNHTLSLSATATGTGGASGGETTGAPIAPTTASAPESTNAAQKLAGGAGALLAAAAVLML